MACNKVEKQCFVMLNVKLESKLTFITLYWFLKLLYNTFALNNPTHTACFAQKVLHILATSG